MLAVVVLPWVPATASTCRPAADAPPATAARRHRADRRRACTPPPACRASSRCRPPPGPAPAAGARPRSPPSARCRPPPAACSWADRRWHRSPVTRWPRARASSATPPMKVPQMPRMCRCMVKVLMIDEAEDIEGDGEQHDACVAKAQIEGMAQDVPDHQHAPGHQRQKHQPRRATMSAPGSAPAPGAGIASPTGTSATTPITASAPSQRGGRLQVARLLVQCLQRQVQHAQRQQQVQQTLRKRNRLATHRR
jgi:hypothetical protein